MYKNEGHSERNKNVKSNHSRKHMLKHLFLLRFPFCLIILISEYVYEYTIAIRDTNNFHVHSISYY